MTNLESLGRTYQDGELIVHMGDAGDNFFVVQEGKIEITVSVNGQTVSLAVCGQGEIIGEWSGDGDTVHSADIRARGETRVVTVHRKHLLRRMHEDPTLAFRILETMSLRIKQMTSRLIELHAGKEKC